MARSQVLSVHYLSYSRVRTELSRAHPLPPHTHPRPCPCPHPWAGRPLTWASLHDLAP